MCPERFKYAKVWQMFLAKFYPRLQVHIMDDINKRTSHERARIYYKSWVAVNIVAEVHNRGVAHENLNNREISNKQSKEQWKLKKMKTKNSQKNRKRI